MLIIQQQVLKNVAKKKHHVQKQNVQKKIALVVPSVKTKTIAIAVVQVVNKSYTFFKIPFNLLEGIFYL